MDARTAKDELTAPTERLLERISTPQYLRAISNAKMILMVNTIKEGDWMVARATWDELYDPTERA
jgi:hypothetical protein